MRNSIRAARAPRVVHLVGGHASWGAARGALWLHQALREAGVRSTAIVQFGGGDLGEGVSAYDQHTWRPLVRLPRNLDRVPIRLFPRRGEFQFSPGIVGTRVLRSAEVRNADLVHLHWINEGFLDVASLRTIRVPVVWTLRDMWPFTGGCHYTQRTGCEKYRTRCEACPELGSQWPWDLAWWGMRRKARAYGPRLTPVGISRWISERAAGSALMGRYRVRTIHNAVDTTAFRPVESRAVRARHGIPSDAPVVLFGAAGAIDDPRKGLRLLLEALETVDVGRPLWLVVFGASSLPLPVPPRLRVQCLGRIAERDALAGIYAMADVFVGPSLQEAFGKTLVEAMACGTPVVAFDGSGPAEIVAHAETGFLASLGSVRELGESVQRVLCLDPRERERMGRAARARAEARFSLEVAGAAYLRLYQELLAGS